MRPGKLRGFHAEGDSVYYYGAQYEAPRAVVLIRCCDSEEEAGRLASALNDEIKASCRRDGDAVVGNGGVR